MNRSEVIRGPTLRESAERGDDITDVLLRYTPNWAKRATQDLYDVVGNLDEIERDQVYEFAGFISFEDYVVNGLQQQMWWVEGAREIIANDRAAKRGTAITVAEADKEIRSKRESMVAESVEMKYDREDGMTQQQIADKHGCSQKTVSNRLGLVTNSDRTEKVTKEPRQRTRYEITNYTKPETAARRIREVFGDEFADQLSECLLNSNFP